MNLTVLETPNGPVVIRPTAPADWGAFRAMRLEALEHHPTAYATDVITTSARPLEFWQEWMTQGAGSSERITYVAEAGAELLGTVSCMRDQSAKRRHVAIIVAVYVREAWRGLRLADALIQHCIKWAEAQGIRKLQLGVVADNPAAIRCYVRCGFTVYGVTREDIYHEGVYYDELLMERSVSHP